MAAHVHQTSVHDLILLFASKTRSTSQNKQPTTNNDKMLPIPEAVRQAIASFRDTEEFKLLPPKSSESSIIFKWGVRVMYKSGHPDEQIGWVCLADQHCRENLEFTPMYSGKTSKATKHLSQSHRCVSDKYTVEVNRKRAREEEVEELRDSTLAKQDPKRMRLLLETKRIIFNQLPFRSGEYEESRVINELCLKEEFRHPVNAKMINHSIVELYTTTKREVLGELSKNDVRSGKFLTVVADFWTCKTQHAKYLGLRVYFINKGWQLESILLGTRRFNPSAADRDSGIRRPFRRWATQMLDDFGLTTDNIFGGMSDAGPDVKWMLQTGFGLQWEWCVAHMSNASTKWACGMVNNKKDSKNPEMTELVERVCKTVRQVRDVEVMGSLFEALCELEGNGRAARLLDYKSHRFLGLTSVVRRVLERWTELEQWYSARADKARRENKEVPVFLLEGKRLDLIQLLSLLEPITVLNKLSQSNECCQVQVLLTLYRLRLQTLNVHKRLRDYRSPPHPAPQVYFENATLTPLIKETRSLLCDAFDKNFFSRYIDRAAIRRQSYVFEMQMLLHPTYKNLDGNLGQIVRLCQAKRDERPETGIRLAEHACDAVIGKAKKIMVGLANQEPAEFSTQAHTPADAEELELLFGGADEPETASDVREGQIDEELSRWATDQAKLRASRENKPESILEFWKRQSESHNYKYLPMLARVIFALPSSSAQIERDFGLSGTMVTSQRSSLSSYNVEMGSFLACNRPYVSVSQCMKIPKENVSDFIPSHMLVGMLDDDDVNQYDTDIINFFSNASVDLSE